MWGCNKRQNKPVHSTSSKIADCVSQQRHVARPEQHAASPGGRHALAHVELRADVRQKSVASTTIISIITIIVSSTTTTTTTIAVMITYFLPGQALVTAPLQASIVCELAQHTQGAALGSIVLTACCPLVNANCSTAPKRSVA
jgi:hypothetical protein